MSEPIAPEEMLEEPSLSHQWVVRRLQRALTLDLAAGALYRGLSAAGPASYRETLGAVGRSAATRARLLDEMIRSEDSVPYSSIGLSRALCRLGGHLAGRLPWQWWHGWLVRLAEHTLSEYDAWQGFVAGAIGIGDTGRRLAPDLLQSAEADYASLSGSGPEPRV